MHAFQRSLLAFYALEVYRLGAEDDIAGAEEFHHSPDRAVSGTDLNSDAAVFLRRHEQILHVSIQGGVSFLYFEDVEYDGRLDVIAIYILVSSHGFEHVESGRGACSIELQYISGGSFAFGDGLASGLQSVIDPQGFTALVDVLTIRLRM